MLSRGIYKETLVSTEHRSRTKSVFPVCLPSQECPSRHLSLPFSFPSSPAALAMDRLFCCVRWFAGTPGVSLPRAGRNAGAAALVTSRGFPLPPHSGLPWPAGTAQQLCQELFLCQRLCLCIVLVITSGSSVRFPYTPSFPTAAPVKAGAAHTHTGAARTRGSRQHRQSGGLLCFSVAFADSAMPDRG